MDTSPHIYARWDWLLNYTTMHRPGCGPSSHRRTVALVSFSQMALMSTAVLVSFNQMALMSPYKAHQAWHAWTAAEKSAQMDAGIMVLIGIGATVEAPSAMNAAAAMAAEILAPIPPPAYMCKVAPGMATACLVVGGIHDQIKTEVPTSQILCAMRVAAPDTGPLIATCSRLHFSLRSTSKTFQTRRKTNWSMTGLNVGAGRSGIPLRTHAASCGHTSTILTSWWMLWTTRSAGTAGWMMIQMTPW